MAVPKKLRTRQYAHHFVVIVAILHYIYLLGVTEQSMILPLKFLDEGIPFILEPFLNESFPVGHEEESVSIIVTSSLIPTHPSIWIIQDTINSIYRYLDGLPEHVPLLIVMDVLGSDATAAERRRYAAAQELIQKTFHWAQLLAPINPARKGLVHSLQTAINRVRTKYVYLIQHDLKFIAYVNHTGLIETMKEYPELDIVRFDRTRNKLHRTERRGNECFGQASPLNDVNSVHFTKSASWSDNTNQLASKEYYLKFLKEWSSEAMISQTLSMERYMMVMAGRNCSKYGTWLYGRKDLDGPYLFHLDGKVATNPPTSPPTRPRPTLKPVTRPLPGTGATIPGQSLFSKLYAAPKHAQVLTRPPSVGTGTMAVLSQKLNNTPKPTQPMKGYSQEGNTYYRHEKPPKKR